MNSLWEQITRHLSPAAARWLAGGFSLAAGVMLAIVLHYVLYRIGLPSTPFIYVAF